jgi:hypothetical protein
MKELRVTVKTASEDFSHTASVPAIMNCGAFKQGAKAKAGLKMPCDLMLEKNQQVLSDADTFESANVPNGSILILTPLAEGG